MSLVYLSSFFDFFEILIHAFSRLSVQILLFEFVFCYFIISIIVTLLLLINSYSFLYFLRFLRITLILSDCFIFLGANSCIPYTLCYESMGGLDPDFLGE